jgi:O-glycosyl hydrolase
VDRRDFMKAAAVGGSAVVLSQKVLAQNATYAVRLDLPKQTIWGLGVEIQSDSIGSNNDGLPSGTVSVPHDLVASERTRLAADMIGRGYGFRYIRLAGGLYLRGTRNDGKNLDGRFTGQLTELASMISTSGAEGVNLEYWSPTPYWKSNNTYIGGKLKQFDVTFLNQFGDAIVEDIAYLNANNIPVVQFGLQNEPSYSTPYSSCVYSDSEYVLAYNAVAAKVRTAHPTVHLHANSLDGQNRSTVRNGLDPSLVDAWTWHKIGSNSNLQIDSAATFKANALGKPVYNNEFEYLDNTTSEARMMNTAQSVMNWFTFVDSPTWYWLHVLKPTYNVEAQGYALGYWRPQDDNDFSKYPNIQKGYFDYELRNWRALVGFLEWMPWNSKRYQIDEPTVRKDQRILAFRQGGSTGKLVIVLTNRGTAPFTFDVNAGTGTSGFSGYRYTLTQWKQALGTKTGPTISVTVPVNGIEFWVQQ